jgi:hypothetical protein
MCRQREALGGRGKCLWVIVGYGEHGCAKILTVNQGSINSVGNDLSQPINSRGDYPPAGSDRLGSDKAKWLCAAGHQHDVMSGD